MDLNPRARDWVLERQARRVQELALETEQAWRAVLRISAHGVPDRLQVHANLMRATRLEPHSQQRRRRQRTLECEARPRLAGAEAADGHPRANPRAAADRRLDRAAAGGRAALDQRQVLTFDPPPGQRRLKEAVDLLRARDDEQP